MDAVELACAYTKQLEMVRLPGAAPSDPPRVPTGYSLRQYEVGDRDSYVEMFQRVFDKPCPLDFWARYVLDEGFFVVEEASSGRLAASCMATRDPGDRHSRDGHLNWLAARPEDRGLGLGLAAAAAVTHRLETEGCPRMWLMTDDHRLSAIGIYLRLGWRPHIFSDHMALRWRDVLRDLRDPDAYADEVKGVRVRRWTQYAPNRDRIADGQAHGMDDAGHLNRPGMRSQTMKTTSSCVRPGATPHTRAEVAKWQTRRT